MLLCGIDEAGRGPVLGPMVMAAAVASDDQVKKIEVLGVQDSKLLSPARRVELFKKLLVTLESYKIITVNANEIDENLFDEHSNLNILEARKTAELLDATHPDEAIVDLPDRNRDRYESMIRETLKHQKVKLVLEHEADVRYPLVSAASILAKVTRDNYIEMLKVHAGEDFGSGYPSDPLTQRFLDRRWNDPHINFFRKSWSAYKDVKIRKEQKSLLEY